MHNLFPRGAAFLITMPASKLQRFSLAVVIIILMPPDKFNYKLDAKLFIFIACCSEVAMGYMYRQAGCMFLLWNLHDQHIVYAFFFLSIFELLELEEEVAEIEL